MLNKAAGWPFPTGRESVQVPDDRVMEGGVKSGTVPITSIAKAYKVTPGKMYGILDQIGVNPSVILPRDRDTFTRRYDEADLDPAVVEEYVGKYKAAAHAADVKKNGKRANSRSPEANAKRSETHRRKREAKQKAEIDLLIALTRKLGKKLLK